MAFTTRLLRQGEGDRRAGHLPRRQEHGVEHVDERRGRNREQPRASSPCRESLDRRSRA